MAENSIKNMLDITMDKLRAAVDADAVVGDPITVGNMTLIPVSKIAFGMASGGSDFSTKNASPAFGGGAGAGVSIVPIAFLAVNGDNVRVLPISEETTVLDRAIAAAPELIDKVKDTFSKKQNQE